MCYFIEVVFGHSRTVPMTKLTNLSILYTDHLSMLNCCLSTCMCKSVSLNIEPLENFFDDLQLRGVSQLLGWIISLTKQFDRVPFHIRASKFRPCFLPNVKSEV